MKIQLIRHATLILCINNKKILVDPMLSKSGTLAPIPDVPNQNFNPLTELPLDVDAITKCDAVLITHTHRDHFDDAAAKLLNKNLPMLCQPEDKVKIQALGFTNVHAIDGNFTWSEITFKRTGGQHGHGKTALEMAPVSGFIITAHNEPSVYISGDTVWCSEVESSISQYKPNIVVCNCGSAQFSQGEPITMDAQDILKLCNNFPNINVVAVHMEAWNHCRLSRNDLQHYIVKNNINNHIFIPADGQIINF